MIATPLAPPFTAIPYETLGSTNDEAKRLARDGAAHGTVVTAERQTAGRGRLDRRWVSPAGNLHASFVLRPDVAPGRAGELAFVAAVAVADAVATLIPDEAEIRVKWPNDVLVRRRKLAGILIETEIAQGALPWIVVGIGINVAEAPSDTALPAIALAELTGKSIGVEPVLAALCASLAATLTLWQREGFAPIRRRWLDRAASLGQSIEIRRGAERLAGRFETIDDDGALVLLTATGPERVSVGDVALVPA